MISYFDYLLNIIDDPNVNTHLELLDILYRIDYRWTVRNDDNRALDGIEIRYNFQADYDISDSEFKELLLVPCSIIEVVCGLAIRMDNVLRDPKEPHINRWFWEMIGNLGLLDFTDKTFRKGVWSLEDVVKIVDIFMDRKYDELGHGGLFPRNFCDKNQKEIELSAQMNGYISEKYC